MPVPKYDVDVLVIGGGSAGIRCARVAAGRGARVLLAERARLGGTCVNVGCIPKKLFFYASQLGHTLTHARGYGWTMGEPAFDWAHFVSRRDAEVQRLQGVYARLLDAAGVRRISESASFVDPHTVRVGAERISARDIVIATGGKPIRLNIPGAEHAWVSDDMFALASRPDRVLVFCGGYIGVEFAGILRGLGSHVTFVHHGEAVLRGFDDDLRLAVQTAMRNRGIDLRLSTSVARIERRGSELRVTLSDGAELDVDGALLAPGRSANVDGLSLESAGVGLDDRGAIAVDANFRTSASNIYAIGDVSNYANLTPVATAEGQWLAEHLVGDHKLPPSLELIPTAVFSQPPLATVGLSEAAARTKFGEIDVYRSSFVSLHARLAESPDATLVKLVVERASGRVLGCHMLGDDAPEIIQGLAIALQCGATKADFDRTIGLHPTVGEEFVTMRSPAS